MININKIYSADFIKTYLQFTLEDLVEPRIKKMLRKVPTELKFDVSSAFSRQEIIKMLTGRPDVLEDVIVRLFDKLPAIAECYCYSYLLKDVVFPIEALKFDLKNLEQKAKFDLAVADAVASLKVLASKHKLFRTPHYIELLESNISRSEKRRHLCRLLNSQLGKSYVTEEDKEVFPDWVKELSRCFDYGVLSKKFGHILVDQLSIAVCPYCALECVQAFPEIEVRPELDHFFPKSRFPFLAVGLYNLIPAGGICNQRHKRDNLMLGRLNPYVTGFEQGAVFKFGFLPDGDLRKNISIEFLPQGCELKDSHVEMFKLESLYSGMEDLREWLAEMYETKQWLKEAGRLKEVDFKQPPYRGYIDLHRPVTKVRAQKFKVDALNDLFEQKLEVIIPPIA
ncbi:hypothetical protein BOW65_11750 [Pseudomonas koreensis]|jgi:hypothetical protein|uniref:hypothetical protein n=1 Tax=Pseudomonas koreensis TaxID=198620 RepID=UPI00098615BE|nr:hypothetical protein [Pseudomonas koreensis]OOH80545.1 hypothetical protein BOW65_11750 [Pseudomonas koreensis]